MSERVQGGRLAARAIAAEGIGAVFTLSGGHVMPIYEGCRKEGIEVVDVRHEQAGAHAAEAYGRIRRSVGVCVATAGPGVTGVVTAVVNCGVAQTPLVVIGGARPLAQAERGALQEFDQLALFKPITKWAAVCGRPDEIPRFVATAFRHALSSPRGPVYLELPMDVLFAEVEAQPVSASRTQARAMGDPRELAKAVDLLNSAERPVVVAGSGIWWDGGWKELASFAENGRFPIYLNGSGRGALPPDHDSFFQHSRNAALDAADVVCVIGTPLDFRLRYGSFGPDARLVHIHSDATELGRNRSPDAGIVGDTAAALAMLAAEVKAAHGPRTAWLTHLRRAEREWWEEHRSEIESRVAPIHHYRLGKALDEVLDPGTVVIGDGGDVVAAVSRVLRVHRPGHWLDPGPFGCLGVGPPYALGVKIARPATQVVVVAGDGAFGLNGFEFETLTRFGLAVTIVIGNDGAWGEIRIPQKAIYGNDAEVATRLASSRYDRLTEAFGGRGEHVERPEQLAPALERALASGEPSIVNVMLDPDAMAGHQYRGM